jgi:hypothetical protein
MDFNNVYVLWVQDEEDQRSQKTESNEDKENEDETGSKDQVKKRNKWITSIC